MSFTIDLAGETALVTGASGGLGRHFATVLAGAGAGVIVTARRTEPLAELCAAIEAGGGRASAHAMDVTDPPSVERAVAAASEAGPITILVNNAGITVTKSFLDLSVDEWDQVLDTNLRGAFLVGQAVARRMTESGGAIVNVASILAKRAGGQVSAYMASKAGLAHLTEAMALELARYRIRVNALCPGYIETDINRGFFAGDLGQAMVKRIPQRRLGRMSDLDGALLLLASPAGAWITGTTVAVDGGHLVSTL